MLCVITDTKMQDQRDQIKQEKEDEATGIEYSAIHKLFQQLQENRPTLGCVLLETLVQAYPNCYQSVETIEVYVSQLLVISQYVPEIRYGLFLFLFISLTLTLVRIRIMVVL